MRVLFVSSGNNKEGISPIIKNQGDSLVKYGQIEVEYYTLLGKGIMGYLSNIRPLNRKCSEDKYDVIHAHYSLSAFVASLAGCKPLVVSLMGSDVKAKNVYITLIRLFAWFFSWKEIIVKSEDMKKSLGTKRAKVIPNGVDLERFHHMDKRECQKRLGWDNSSKHILFASNPARPEKNFALAKKAVEYLHNDNYIFHFLKDVPNIETPYWYNAADVVLLTSFWEGSPNAVKETMACNVPIVTTNVGDVSWLFGDAKGCFLTTFDVPDCARKIETSLVLSEEVEGRKRIEELGIGSESVANQLIDIYNTVK